MISQETRERAEARARDFYHRENKLKDVWGKEVFKGHLLVLAMEYALGQRLEAALRQQGEAGWVTYLQEEEISREEAEEYMHMAAAVDGYQFKSCKDIVH